MEGLDRYIRIFRDEALEHLDALRTGLLHLEEGTGDGEETIPLILRCAHTLKGSARMVGLTEIGDLSHKMEDVLKGIEKGRVIVSTDLISLLLEVADAIRDGVEAAARGQVHPPGFSELIERVKAAASARSQPPDLKPVVAKRDEASEGPEKLLDALEGIFGDGEEEGSVPSPAFPKPIEDPGGPEVPEPLPAGEPMAPKPPPAPAPSPEKGKKTEIIVPKVAGGMETIRVDVKKLDNLTNLAGELVINRIRMENKYFMARDLAKALVEFLDDQEQKISAPKEQEWMPFLRARIRNELRTLVDDLFRDIQELDTLVSELQTLTLDLRLLPVSTIFDAYFRTVRDLRQALGKEVSLHASGRETLIDKRVLEEINPAIIHLIRNAVDHGIESVEERKRLEKEAVGSIHLEAFSEGGNVVIQVGDDGAGMDPRRIREAAVEKGVISAEEGESLGDREALNLVFRYGFSTSAIITDLSGRGVGLNVVWEKVEALKGNINIDTKPGKYTTVRLSFPPTYFTLNTLVVKVGTEIVALPSNFLVETRWVEPEEFSLEGGRPVIFARGSILPVIDLRTFLGFPAPETARKVRRTSVVIVEFRNEVLGLSVDKILRFEEEVVKSSGPFLQNHPFVSGVTILRKGEPCFILNIYDIFKYAREWRESGEAFLRIAEEKPRKQILVVDDSITTRTLEKSILENAGYDVTVARDGTEALTLARAESFSLVVTDVQMPGLSGFELTETLRADVRYKDVPVVIVTSLARDEDRRRGIEVGAQAYIVKGTFDQTQLLDTVKNLIG